MNKAVTFELTLTRQIQAPRGKVFDAFITPELMKVWMCPRGMSVPEANAEPKVGGRFKVVMRARDGETFTATGVYREIERPARLVYSWQWQGDNVPPGETLITVHFTEAGGGTEVRMTHSGFPDAGLRDSHRQGWSSSLNNLLETFDPRGTAANVKLYGDARSTYVRTARIGLAEKGVAHALAPAELHSAALLALHPFDRMPAFRDGELVLYETSAILRYAEEAFPGPSLLPGNITDRARAEQWVSAINSYLYDLIVRRYLLQHLFPRGADGKPDRAVIDAAVIEMRHKLPIVENGYGSRAFLAGAQPTLPDFFLAPIIAYLKGMPEGAALLEPCPRLRAAQSAIEARESFKATAPQT